MQLGPRGWDFRPGAAYQYSWGKFSKPRETARNRCETTQECAQSIDKMIYYCQGTGFSLRSKYALQESLLMTPRRSSAVQKSRGAAPPGDASVRGCGENSIHFFENSFFWFCQKMFGGDSGWLWRPQVLLMDSCTLLLLSLAFYNYLVNFPAQREALSGPNQS